MNITAHFDALAKPPGSLGKLERIAARLCTIQRTLTPITRPRSLVVFAGDHGVVSAGVTMWPSAVTGVVLQAMRDGRAACSVMAAALDVSLTTCDVGTLVDGTVVRGTRNLAVEAALSVDEARAAWKVGMLAVNDAPLQIAGEVGIGNTTSAACLAMLLADVPLDDAVGPGAGADPATLEQKRIVVANAVERVRTWNMEEAIAAVAGAEILAMAGFYAEAARRGHTILVDGFIATAAALIAERLASGTRQYFIAAHRSAEPGHTKMLAALELEPILDNWSMRLGEGTGALAALGTLDAAAAMCRMATLAELLS